MYDIALSLYIYMYTHHTNLTGWRLYGHFDEPVLLRLARQQQQLGHLRLGIQRCLQTNKRENRGAFTLVIDTFLSVNL